MICLKCGKTTKGEQVFCQQCLETMEAYPVKSDVHIQLPSRPEEPVQKKQSRKRRPANQDELIAQLRWKVKKQRILMMILLLVVVASAAVVFFLLKDDVLPIFG